MLSPVIAIGGHHKLLPLQRQQIVFPHQPQHPLVIHHHPHLLVQFKPHPPVSVAPPVLHHDLLHRRPHHHLLFLRTLLGVAAVVASPTHHRHLAHLLHTQTASWLSLFQLSFFLLFALHAHYFPDLVIDPGSPTLLLCRRRTSTLCKAPRKKSTSSTFSASAFCNCSTSVTSDFSRRRSARSTSGSSFSCHRARPRRSTPNSAATSARCSPAFTLATAACQNSSPRRFAPLTFATRSSFPAQWGYYLCLTFGVQDTSAIHPNWSRFSITRSPDFLITRWVPALLFIRRSKRLTDPLPIDA